MATLNDLKKYLNYEFSSGPYTGQDYRTFQNKYISYLRKLCKQSGWEFVKANRNHYCFTAFIKDDRSQYIYLSISDVRYFTNEWYNNILVRNAAHEKDYSGGSNNFTTLPKLQSAITRLFYNEVFYAKI